MQLRYRGISYQYNPPRFFPTADYHQNFSSEATLYLRVLRYRGIHYLRPVLQSPIPESSIAETLSSEGLQENRLPETMTIQPCAIGCFGYRLYCLGWHDRLHQSRPQCHLLSLLLNAFSYYRQGFRDAAQWSKENR